ncbi:DEAD/DEAH box helicase family protein [Candidatus Pacearchaeota archaeon]|nr:DEAD/DEAH box helicase family protein [Candidatus Pacearchaeota archaeon]
MEEEILKYLKDIFPREYQQEIFSTCRDKNCLVVLPTGLGKTLIALLLAIERMIRFPQEKIVFLAPTRPLAEQHLKYFQKHLPELFATMELFTGKTSAEKRQELWERAEIIFSTPQCVEGKTQIFTRNGPIPIEEFFNNIELVEENYEGKKGYTAKINEEVLGLKNDKIAFVRVIKALKMPVKYTLEIKTSLGNSIECTPEHPLLTISPRGELNWKNAEKLKEGDFVAIAKEICLKENSIIEILPLLKKSYLRVADKEKTRHLLKLIKDKKKKGIKEYSRFRYNFMPLELFLDLAKQTNFDYGTLKLTDWEGKSYPVTIPKYLDAKLSYILGAMLGDGHIGNREGHGKEVVFSDLDYKENTNYFKNTLFEVFGIKMKDAGKKGLIVYNSALAEILCALGVPKGKKSHKIRVPNYIFTSETANVRGFLKGIFDADGCASRHNVLISSISKKFIEDIKWLALRLGIVGSMESAVSRSCICGRVLKSSTLYSFRFSGRNNLDKFLMINPEREKCKLLLETIINTKKPFTRAKEIIPVNELIKKIYLDNPKKFEKYLSLCLSIDNLTRIADISKGENAEKLRQLLKMPIRWAKIKNIEKKSENKWVYDFTIENEHNFLTNTIISHNCISNDIKNNLYSLKNVSLLIEDECHRCIKNYSYTYIAEKYKEQGVHKRILGLTASPGHEEEKIKKICQSLDIEAVEVRTRNSEDVKEYLQELKFEIIKLDFPPEFVEIRDGLKIILDKKINELKKRRLLFGISNKKTLLDSQFRIMRAISSGNKNFNLLLGASACAQALKVQHALELLETQTLESVFLYFQELFEQARKAKSKAVQNLIKQKEFNSAYIKISELIAKKREHPKLIKLKEIVSEEMSKNSKTKIIIFSQYRSSVAKICREMNSISGARAKVFVGQAKKGEGDKETGLSQKEQQELVRDFSSGEINILVATQIAEEGLDIPEVNAVIFYEPIPSAIRKIQRAGRTARLMEGKLIMLITKDTRDESYYWTAFHKEKKMYKAIDSIQKEFNEEKIEEDKQEKLF